jgi:23S rRNA pseudouridine1911/1915/1917 synthase
MKLIVEKSDIRLDKYLAEKMPAISRTKLQNMVRLGLIKINGRISEKPSLKLRSGDELELEDEALDLPGKFKIEPENLLLDVIYEDTDIAVINKPAGLIVHPTPKIKKGTLVNRLLACYPEIKNVGENPLRPGIVHRIDKDTSGLIIVAKNQPSFEFIKKQFLAKTVQKNYLAIVEGMPGKIEGEITYDIRPSTANRLKKVAVKKISEIKNKSHRTAKTLYKVKQNFDDKFALLEISPLTGRTHQIRVHLSAIGHPIVGDALYGSKSHLAKRQMLHAGELKFMAPNGRNLSLEIPPPKDFQDLIKKLLES